MTISRTSPSHDACHTSRNNLPQPRDLAPLGSSVTVHSHVQAPRDPGALERLGLAKLLAEVHETGHLVLGELNLLAAESGEGDVGDLVGLWGVSGTRDSGLGLLCTGTVGEREKGRRRVGGQSRRGRDVEGGSSDVVWIGGTSS
jgi:hypothetical protein